ncbi:MAG: hypothetical protein QXL01_00080 [Thermoplasmatales archaeon]
MLGLEPKWVEVDCVGETPIKLKYFGRFLVKPYLSHRERSAAIQLAEKYMIGINTSIEQQAFLSTLAFLKIHIQDMDDAAKKWWGDDGLDLIDERPITQLAEQIKKIQQPGEEEKKEEPSKEEPKKDKKT